MENDFTPGADPEEIKCFLHGLGLVTLDEYYAKLKQMLKRQRHSSSLTNEQIQRKFMENNLFKDNLSKNMPLLCPRKRTSFSLVIPRKRVNKIKKQESSSSQLVTNSTTATATTTTSTSSTECAISPIDDTDTIDYDQPLDLRLQLSRISKC